jgi:hypothetical protein
LGKTGFFKIIVYLQQKSYSFEKRVHNYTKMVSLNRLIGLICKRQKAGEFMSVSRQGRIPSSVAATSTAKGGQGERPLYYKNTQYNGIASAAGPLFTRIKLSCLYFKLQNPPTSQSLDWTCIQAIHHRVGFSTVKLHQGWCDSLMLI